MGERLLVLAPLKQDTPLICSVLQKAGLSSRPCTDLDDLLDAMRAGAGAVLLAEEALTPAAAERLADVLAAQPAWSDLPFILFTSSMGPLPETHRVLAALDVYSGVTLLERPVSTDTLLSAARSALRARRRQYEVRDLAEHLEARVEARTRQVRELSSRLTLAEHGERQRISQILHDSLQQLLYGINMQVQFLAEDLGDRPALRDQAGRITELLAEAIRTTRTLAVDLSPPILHEEGLAAALHWLALRMEKTYDLKVDLEADCACAIEHQDLRVLLFQCVRELLFNTVKYAGVDRARVEVYLDSGRCVIRIVDHGVGFDPQQSVQHETAGGFGLYSIRERLQLVGGCMEIDAAPGAGTRVTITIPRPQLSR